MHYLVGAERWHKVFGLVHVDWLTLPVSEVQSEASRNHVQPLLLSEDNPQNRVFFFSYDLYSVFVTLINLLKKLMVLVLSIGRLM